MSDERGAFEPIGAQEHGFEVRTLEPGWLVELGDGRLVEVAENPRDGMWVLCREVDGLTGLPGESVEPVYCYELSRVVRR